jgi:hypothetical protein
MSKVITVKKTVMKAVLKLAPGDGINGRGMLAPLRGKHAKRGTAPHSPGRRPYLKSAQTERSDFGAIGLTLRTPVIK